MLMGCLTGQQVSVIAQENLKLAAFLSHHRLRCTLDWEITGVNEGTVPLMIGQKKLKDSEYKDPNVLPKINKLDMAGMIEAFKENLRLHHGVVWAPLAYVIWKIITVWTYGDYPLYATSDDEMISRMIHLPSEKNKLLHETDNQTVQRHMPEYQIDKRTVYDILDQICKDTDLYHYVKQHKPKRDG